MVQADEWRQTSLREVVTKLVDGSHNPPSKHAEGYPMLSARNVENGRIVFDEFRYIEESAFQYEDRRTRITPGDVLLTIVGTIGRTAVVPSGTPLFVLQRSVAVLSPTSELLPKFLSYQLQAPFVQRYFVENARGTAQKGVYLKTLSATPLVVPSVATQAAVVAEIEKQFSRLDEAVANLQRVKANLKRYKASVLKAAVEGRLVPTEAELARREGRSYESGRQLLDRMLESRRDQWARSTEYQIPVNRVATGPIELPEGWAWTTYEQVGRLQLGRQRAPRYHSGANMRPYLRVQNVFEDRIDLSDVKEMDFPPSDYEKYQLAPGDLLLNEGQSPELLGRPAIYRGELPGACFTNTLIRLRAAEGLSVEFALHVSRHYMLAGRFVDEGTITTNIAHLSLGRLATVEFPLPPHAEQVRIVAEVERRLSVLREIGSEVDINLRRAQALRQSVLQRAFSGDLALGDVANSKDVEAKTAVAKDREVTE